MAAQAFRIDNLAVEREFGAGNLQRRRTAWEARPVQGVGAGLSEAAGAAMIWPGS